MNRRKSRGRETSTNVTEFFINSWRVAGRKALSLVLSISVVMPCLLSGTVPAYAEENEVYDSAPIAGFGNALRFTSSGTVALNQGIMLDSAYTEEAWIYPSNDDNEYHAVIASDNIGDTSHRAPSVWVCERTRIHAGFGDGTYWNNIVTDFCLTADAWNHVAVVFDGTTIKVYVNGTPVKLSMYRNTEAVTSFTSTPYHGPSVKYFGDNFCGKVDEVRIWNSALPQEEIQDGMNRPIDENDIKSGHLAGSWNFNKGTGTSVAGQGSGAQNDGLTGSLSAGITWCASDIPLKYTVQKGGSATVALTGIIGDDKDSSTLSYEIVSTPTHGTLTEKDSGIYEYKNDGTSLEEDSFTYRVAYGESVSENTTKVELSVSGITAQQGENSNDYVTLDWKGLPYDRYMVRKKSPDRDEFQSIPLKRIIKVLNVYPDISGSDNLQSWMSSLPAVGGYYMTVDKIGLNAFNTDYNNCLKDKNGDYKYDVVYFGGWDSNNGEDISADAEAAVKELIDYGGGCLLGHDTVDGSTNRHFIPIAKTYLSMILDQKFSFYGDSNGTSTLAIVKKGMLTDFPHNLGGVGTQLIVPASHTTYQFATSDIWMKYLTDLYYKTPETTTWKDNATDYSGTNNFYLTTKNNVAMIQTGHSNGAASDDEKKILANTLYYLAQVSTDTSFDDHTAQDVAAPGKITSVLATTDKTKNTTIRFDAPKDSGSTYEYQLDTFNCLGNKTESNPVQATVTTGVAGYKVIVSQSETAPTDSDFTNVAEQTDTFFTVSNLPGGQNYVHIRTFDKAGNYSDSTVDFWVGNHAPKMESSTKYLPLKEDAESGTGTAVNDLLKSASASDQDGDSLGIAVTSADSSKGEWQYQASSGGQWQTVGSVKDSDAWLLPAGSSIRFVSAMNFNGNASITYRAWDGTKDSAYSIADASVYNDTGAYSSETATATATVSAVNDAPQIVKRGTNTNALDFGGSSQYVSAADDFNLNGSFTFEAWVNVRTAGSFSRFFDFGNGAGNYNQWLGFDGITETVRFELFDNQNERNPIVTSEKLPLNQWKYITAVFDKSAGAGTIYFDGDVKATGTLPSSISSVARVNNYFGKSNWDVDKYLDGSMYGIKIWKTARSQAQVQNDMNSVPTGNETGLAAYYPLTEQSGSTAISNLKGGHPGVLHGVTLPAFTYAVSTSTNTNVAVDELKINDPDAGSGNMTLNLCTSNGGALNFSNAGGTDIIGNETASVTVNGTLGEINIALQSLQYQPKNDSFGTDTITATINDNGNTGEGGSLTDTKTVGVTISPRTGKSILSTAIGTLSSNTIQNIPYSVTALELKKTLTLSDGATAKVILVSDNSAVSDHTPVSSGMAVRVSAEDGSQNDYLFSVLPGIAVACSGQALKFDGVDDYADIAANSAFATSNFTVEGWIQYPEKQGWNGVIDKGRNNCTDWYILTSGDGNIGILAGMPGAETELGYNWDDTNWHYVSITYDGADFALYVDGQLKKTAKVSHYSATNHNISFGRRQAEYDNGGSNWKYYKGNLDDVRIWNSARTAEEIERDMVTYSAGDEKGLLGYWKMDLKAGNLLKNYGSTADSADGTLSGASYIVSGAWQNRSTDKNMELTIDAGYVTDSGNPAIVAQSHPQHGSLRINAGKLIYTPVKDYFGNDSFTYTVTNSTNNNAATYSVRIAVNPTAEIPVIPNLPISQTIAAGGTATFDATASVTDGGAVTYQWEKSTDGGNTWQTISGATNGTYTTPTLSASDNGSEYRCEVTNTKDGVQKAATSTPSTLTVTAAPQEPTISSHPAPNPIAAGGTVTLDAIASVTDGGAVTYQWEKSTDGGQSWRAINGATSSTYTTPMLSDSDNNSEYRCKVMNTKDGVSISVVTAPNIVMIRHAGGSGNSEHSNSSGNSDHSSGNGNQKTNSDENSNNGKTETVTAKTDGVISNGNTAEINTSVSISNNEANSSHSDSTGKGTVIVNFPTDVVKQELEAKKNVSLNVTVPHSAVTEQNNSFKMKIDVSAEMIQAAKDNGRDITISVYDAETKKKSYQWQFKGEDLLKSSVEVKDVDITMSVHKIAEVPRVNAIAQQKNGLVLSFDYSGLLPSAAGIKISAAEKGFKPGDNLWFYYFNPTTKHLESTGNQYTVDAEGYITVKISHCSDYVLIPMLSAVQKSANVLRLDTTMQYNMYLGGKYYFLAFPGKQVKVSARAGDSSVLRVRLVNAKDHRGWYFEIEGLKTGSTDVIVTASNGTVGRFPVTVKSGEMILDTSSCTLPVNSLYDISAKILGPGSNRIRAITSNWKVASVFRLRNGHYQVKGLSLGTAKIVFLIIDEKGKVIASAYTGINVGKTDKRFGNSARVTAFY